MREPRLEGTVSSSIITSFGTLIFFPRFRPPCTTWKINGGILISELITRLFAFFTTLVYENREHFGACFCVVCCDTIPALLKYTVTFNCHYKGWWFAAARNHSESEGKLGRLIGSFGKSCYLPGSSCSCHPWTAECGWYEKSQTVSRPHLVGICSAWADSPFSCCIMARWSLWNSLKMMSRDV